MSITLNKVYWKENWWLSPHFMHKVSASWQPPMEQGNQLIILQVLPCCLPSYWHLGLFFFAFPAVTWGWREVPHIYSHVPKDFLPVVVHFLQNHWLFFSYWSFRLIDEHVLASLIQNSPLVPYPSQSALALHCPHHTFSRVLSGYLLTSHYRLSLLHHFIMCFTFHGHQEHRVSKLNRCVSIIPHSLSNYYFLPETLLLVSS